MKNIHVLPEIGTKEFNDLASAYFGGKPKQETLEEFIQRQLSLGKYQDQESAIRHSIESGANWQQQQMYSEKEVQVKLYECLGHFAQKHNIIINGNEIDSWFEQFKKK